MKGKVLNAARVLVVCFFFFFPFFFVLGLHSATCFFTSGRQTRPVPLRGIVKWIGIKKINANPRAFSAVVFAARAPPTSVYFKTFERPRPPARLSRSAEVCFKPVVAGILGLLDLRAPHSPHRRRRRHPLPLVLVLMGTSAPFNEPPGSPLSTGRSGVNSRGRRSQDHRLHNASDC